ncbi:MAG: exonuclease SbcCD subunit D [Desulfovibrionales bacterium]
MFRFLHAADLHLDSPLQGLETYPDAPVEQIRAASRRALDNLVDLAISEDVNFLVIAGDLFDVDWKDYHTALFFAQRMGRLGRAGIPVFVASGNHDAASVISRALRFPDNVSVFSHKKPETLFLEDLGVALHGQGYAERQLRDNLAAGYPFAVPGLFNIGVLHTALTGRAGHDLYAPCSPSDLRAKGYHYWALGHIHQREVICEDPWIVFSGCLQGRHIKEAGSKGATLVTVDDGRTVEVEHRDLDVLRWASCPVTIDGLRNQGELLDALVQTLTAAKSHADGRPLAVRITLAGTCLWHNQLQERRDALFEEAGAIAAGLGDIWLERVVFDLHPQETACTQQSSDSPVLELIESLAARELHMEELLQELPELEELKSKLPPAVLSGEDPFDPTDLGMLESMKPEIRDLLMSRLLRHEEGT